MMDMWGWIPGTALGSNAGPASSPVQANTWGMERPPRAGIGTAPWNLVSPTFDKMWDVVLRKIRRTDVVPVAMLRSQSFSADKGNQKGGIGGKRVMHAYCSLCMAWHSSIHGRAEKIDRPDWVHGGLAHRSRECALTVVQQSQWRLNELGLACVLSNFDGSNAFRATRRELLISTAQTAKEKDKMCAADSLQHGSMTLDARDGPVTLMASSGAQMGFTLAPRDFNDCYNPKVDQWRQHFGLMRSTRVILREGWWTCVARPLWTISAESRSSQPHRRSPRSFSR